MSFEHRTGDLFDQHDVEAIGHGVNCKGLMGSGIAVRFRNAYPEMHDKYVKLCKEKQLELGQVWPWHEESDGLWIFNIASQFKPGRNAEYEALFTGVQKALAFCEAKGIKSLALPQIGAGIGGLEWETVRAGLEELAEASPVHLVMVTWEG